MGVGVENETVLLAGHPVHRVGFGAMVGAGRGPEGQWLAAQRPEELRPGVEANLRSLELSQLALVNLRRHPDSEVPLAEQIDAMTALLDKGLIGGATDGSAPRRDPGESGVGLASSESPQGAAHPRNLVALAP